MKYPSTECLLNGCNLFPSYAKAHNRLMAHKSFSARCVGNAKTVKIRKLLHIEGNCELGDHGSIGILLPTIILRTAYMIGSEIKLLTCALLRVILVGHRELTRWSYKIICD